MTEEISIDKHLAEEERYRLLNSQLKSLISKRRQFNFQLIQLYCGNK